jgi:serine/threonine protein kinase
MENYQTQETIIMLSKEQQIKELFWSTLETPKEHRLEFLSKACAGNNELYEEVISLLNSHEEADSFLEKPVANFAAKLVKEEKESLAGTSKEAFLEQLSGRVLDGKYSIEKQLGRGGMGAVYQAVHLGTKRPVAVKVIAPQFMTHSEFVERFKREAQAAGKLSHPNVVNVTDFGIASFGSAKVAYLVMEYLKGLTLGDLIKKKGKLPISFTIDILQQVCSAVGEAHNQSIIHRDLKPDNIWLEPDGRGSYHVKVLDFGLAKLYSNNLSDESTSPDSLPTNTSFVLESKPISLLQKASNNRNSFYEKETQSIATGETVGNIDPRSVPEWMTRVGMVLGTPLYMSPEQCHGKKLDPKSDIYSLGIIAYEMLCGEPPFNGDMYQLIQKHSEMPPIPLQKKVKNIPKHIADI